jgi:hypothetical protein
MKKLELYKYLPLPTKQKDEKSTLKRNTGRET